MVGQIIYLPGHLIYLPGLLIYLTGHLMQLSNPGRGCVARQSEQECVFLGRETSHTGFFRQNLYIRLNLMFNNLRRARYRSDRLAQSQTDRSDRLPPLRSQFFHSHYHLACICRLCRDTVRLPSSTTGCPKKTHFQNCAAPPNPPASIHILRVNIQIHPAKI